MPRSWNKEGFETHASWRIPFSPKHSVSLGIRNVPDQKQLEQLQTIQGVGLIVAATTIATFSDVERFANAKKAASYSGLVPSTYQSGGRDAHGRITKQGSSELRAMLCEAAHHAARPKHPLHPYFSALCAKRGYNMAGVVVAHRLCRIMFAMLRDGTEFDWRKLPLEMGPFEQIRTKLFRLKLQPAETSRGMTAA